MRGELTLKERLSQISGEDFRVDNEIERFALVLEMMVHIGSPDSELRDGLIYTAFHTWISGGFFSSDQLRHLLTLALDENHLFYRLGDKGSDAVFTRSFSMLLLPLLLIAHRQRPYLTQPEIVNLKDTVIRYLNLEQDARGYDPQKGWAHAIAHAADALDDLTLCEELRADDLLDILAAVQQKMGTKDYVFVDEEDERMVTAVVSLFSRQVLGDTAVSDWILSYIPFVTEVEAEPTNSRYLNVKNFLRSLYFRLCGQGGNEAICQVIFEVVKEIGRFK